MQLRGMKAINHLIAPAFRPMAIGNCTALEFNARRFSVMKNSWPSFRPPRNPDRPTTLGIVRQIDDNNKPAKDTQQAAADSKAPPGQHALPRAAAIPEKFRAIPKQSIKSSGQAASAPSQQWHPPGWGAGQQDGLPFGTKTRAPRKRDTLGKDRPTFEVWGMRVVGVLLVAVAYVELRDISFGPAGIRKQPHRVSSTEKE